MKIKQHVLSMVVFVLASGVAASSAAQVTLENSIRKVLTEVNPQGEVQRELVAAESVVPGDELQYIIQFKNEGELPVDAGTIVITNMIPEHTEYLKGTAFGSGTQIKYSIDGEAFAAPQDLKVADADSERPADPTDYAAIRWNFAPVLEPGASGYVSFNVRLK